MIKKILEVRKTLATPQKWTKNCFARDTNGHVVPSDNPMAVCWCLGGAIDLAFVGRFGSIDHLDTLRLIRESLPDGYGTIESFNDDSRTSHSDVIGLLDRCIEKLTRCRLEDALSLIDTPAKWSRNSRARDSQGKNVYWKSKEACLFDATGAVLRASDGIDEVVDSNIKKLFFAIRKIYPRLHLDISDKARSVQMFNDHLDVTHPMIVAVFKEAMKP